MNVNDRWMNGTEVRCAKKVLIVDDEPHIVRVLKIKLENAGFEVITAVNGVDGMEKFLKEKPAVVISDINMPYINGRELYEIMDRHKETHPSLVIVITSSLDGALRTWAKEQPNIYFVEKPFSPTNIMNLVNHYYSVQRESNAPR